MGSRLAVSSSLTSAELKGSLLIMDKIIKPLDVDTRTKDRARR